MEHFHSIASKDLVQMITNYQRALELMQDARDAEADGFTLKAAAFVAQAQVYATLAVADATRDRA